MVMARMRAGFALIADTQFLPGYSVLLTDDPAVTQLNELDRARLRARTRATVSCGSPSPRSSRG